MKVNLKTITGPWKDGVVLDKHMLKSVFLGQDEWGHNRFDNTRTEVGEATYQLKYQNDWGQVQELAQALAKAIQPWLSKIDFIAPMPASKQRSRQPVTEVAIALGKIINKPVVDQLLLKKKTGQSLKDIGTKAEKLEAIGDSMSVDDQTLNNGRWNCLLIDDLFHSGASMEKACTVLRTTPKVADIYVAALTWKP